MSTTRREFLVSVSAAVAAGMTQGGFHTGVHAADNRKLGIAVVGLGNLSTEQLLPALQTTQRCRLAAIVSGSPETASSWADRFELAPRQLYRYDQFDQIAADDSIDIVCIALPNSMHAEYTIRAARAGKHVLCETPMAKTSEECRQMIAACRRADRILGVGFRPPEEPLGPWMESAAGKSLGRIQSVVARFSCSIGDPDQWRLKKTLSGGGAMMGLGVQALRACRGLFGEEPQSIVAQETKTDANKFAEVEESITWNMRFPSGGQAYCSTSYNFDGPNRLWVIGENAACDTTQPPPHRTIDGLEAIGQPDRLSWRQSRANYMDEFATCVLDQRPPRYTGDEGLKDLLSIEAIYRSMRNQSVVEVSSS